MLNVLFLKLLVSQKILQKLFAYFFFFYIYTQFKLVQPIL